MSYPFDSDSGDFAAYQRDMQELADEGYFDGPDESLDDDEAEAIETTEGIDNDDEHDQFRTDAEADADALASAGWGTDEDYGDFGGDEY